MDIPTEPTISTETYRTCAKCSQTKSVDLFRKLGSKKSYECKECYNRLSRLGIKTRIPDVEVNGVLTRICSFCQVPKSLDEFMKSNRCLGGRTRKCKACDRKDRTYISTPEKREKHRIKEAKRRKADPLHKTKLNAYYREKLANDPLFKLRHTMRNSISCRLRRKRIKKNEKTVGLLGCSIVELKAYLEAKFQPGMTWDNYGWGENKWNVDHVRPCASFDLTDPEQQKICFHYTNLQPLWHVDNMLKRDFQ